MIQIRQETRTLFSAGFSIAAGEAAIGKILLRGSIWSPESKVEICLPASNILLHKKRGIQIFDKNIWRPYAIEANGLEIGEIYGTNEQREQDDPLPYTNARIRSSDYRLYSIGFGAEGAKYPIYLYDTRVGLVRKPAEVINDMYHFDLLVSDEVYVEAGVIFAAYMYATSFFTPGTMMTKGWKKTVSFTSDDDLLSRYNAQFENDYE